MIPALGRQRQEELCEFQASLVYIASSRPAGATGKPCLKKAKKKKKERGYFDPPFEGVCSQGGRRGAHPVFHCPPFSDS